MESLRRAHQIDFTLPNQVRRPLLAWTKDAYVFLRGLETLATPESLQPPGQDAPAGTPAPETPIQPPIPAADQSSLLSSIYTDDVLESRTVQLVVRLVATLGHHSLDARTKAMAMLFQLAVKMDDKFTGSEKTFEGILSKMELDDYGADLVL